MKKLLFIFLGTMILNNIIYAQCDGQAQFEDQRDGTWYNQITIGTQCWMAENLNHGTTIHSCTGGALGNGTQTNDGIVERYCTGCPNNFLCGTQGDCNALGGLYQWDEAMQYSTTNGAQGICPTGWHIPTDAEWQTMEQNLNPAMSAAQAAATGWRGTTQGNQIKTAGLCLGGTDCGTSGFEGIGGGVRTSAGANPCWFYLTTGSDLWWTSTNWDATQALSRYTANSQADVFRGPLRKADGMSVRCLRDNAAWPLPVELLYFKADWVDQKYDAVELIWETVFETSNSHFEIERSVDAINFEYLDQVEGYGTSNQNVQYTALDLSPYKMGTSYYRLKQVDFNGDFRYSNIEALNVPEGLNMINLYPNPTIDQFTVLFTSFEDLETIISIKNALGQEVRLLKHQINKGFNSVDIDVSELGSGSYFFEIGTSSGLYKMERKFIKSER